MLVILYWVASALQIGRIWWRNRQGIAWHTMSFGVSWAEDLHLYSLPYIGQFFNDWILFRFIEPLVCFIIGYFIFLDSGVDVPIGMVLVTASITLFIKNNLIYFQHLSRILDLRDARIEGMYFNEKAFYGSKKDRAGYTFVRPALPEFQPDDSILSHMVTRVRGEVSPAPTNRKEAFAHTVAQVMGDNS